MLDQSSTPPLCACGCGEATTFRLKPFRWNVYIFTHRCRMPRRPLADRFWEKVDHAGPIPSHCPALGACWIWIGAVHGISPYGIIWVYPHGYRQAHRVSWEMHRGAIPDGTDVCHHCDNPRCVRPDHLFTGTARDNMRDAVRKGRVIPPNRTKRPRPAIA